MYGRMIINISGTSCAGAHLHYLPIQAGIKLKAKKSCLNNYCDEMIPDPLLTFKKKVILLLAHTVRDVDVSLLASKNLSITSMELNEQTSLYFLFQPSRPTFD